MKYDQNGNILNGKELAGWEAIVPMTSHWIMKETFFYREIFIQQPYLIQSLLLETEMHIRF
ncbi:MAG: hypothetical protein M3R36_15065 [Bacteroidota bacterium]|nr:hypothetical protein [Bacteroidota bacterium]